VVIRLANALSHRRRHQQIRRRIVEQQRSKGVQRS
jgi:hypothetical protein